MAKPIPMVFAAALDILELVEDVVPTVESLVTISVVSKICVVGVAVMELEVVLTEFAVLLVILMLVESVVTTKGLMEINAVQITLHLQMENAAPMAKPTATMLVVAQVIQASMMEHVA